jgi:hypothetical protein
MGGAVQAWSDWSTQPVVMTLRWSLLVSEETAVAALAAHTALSRLPNSLGAPSIVMRPINWVSSQVQRKGS